VAGKNVAGTVSYVAILLHHYSYSKREKRRGQDAIERHRDLIDARERESSLAIGNYLSMPLTELAHSQSLMQLTIHLKQNAASKIQYLYMHASCKGQVLTPALKNPH